MSANFDTTALLKTDLDAEILSVVTNEFDKDPNRVLELGQPWEVTGEWRVWGLDATAIGGTWELKVFLESMGAGFEGQVGSATVTVLPAADQTYKQLISITGANPPDPALYKLVILIQHVNTLGKKTRMAGFAEGPYLEFYNPDI
jgi:hypothetical protein